MAIKRMFFSHRLHGSCNHIAALLFRVEYAVRTGITKPTCTSVLALWPQSSSFSPAVPVKLGEQLWKRDHYFKQGNVLQKHTFIQSVYTYMI
jgi:hypothetical protein